MRCFVPLVALAAAAILPAQGDTAEGIVTPENRRLVSAYTAKYRRPPTIYAEQGYVGAQMIASALEAVRGNVEGSEEFLALPSYPDMKGKWVK